MVRGAFSRAKGQMGPNARIKVIGSPNPVAQTITSASRVRPSLNTTLLPSDEIPTGSASLTSLIFPSAAREWKPDLYDMARPPKTLGPLKGEEEEKTGDDQRRDEDELTAPFGRRENVQVQDVVRSLEVQRRVGTDSETLQLWKRKEETVSSPTRSLHHGFTPHRILPFPTHPFRNRVPHHSTNEESSESGLVKEPLESSFRVFVRAERRTDSEERGKRKVKMRRGVRATNGLTSFEREHRASCLRQRRVSPERESRGGNGLSSRTSFERSQRGRYPAHLPESESHIPSQSSVELSDICRRLSTSDNDDLCRRRKAEDSVVKLGGESRRVSEHPLERVDGGKIGEARGQIDGGSDLEKYRRRRSELGDEGERKVRIEVSLTPTERTTLSQTSVEISPVLTF